MFFNKKYNLEFLAAKAQLYKYKQDEVFQAPTGWGSLIALWVLWAKMKIESLRQTRIEQTNERMKIRISWAVGAKNVWEIEVTNIEILTSL